MKTRVLNHPIAVDNFGNAVYICQYTDKPVSVQDAVFIGSVIPQLNGTYVCSSDAMDAFKASKRLFDESEANCNTCQKLERVKHDKRRDGQLVGKCEAKGQHLFHPNDHMGMDCYVARCKK